jgi:tetratricopeptide (TPR) repeat protein
MTSPEAAEPLSPFDEFLDRLLRGETVDVDGFLRAHPGMTDDERRKVGLLCGGRETVAGPPPTVTDAPPAGRLGPYRLRERIGAGSMGAVFLAEDGEIGRTVAVKIIAPDFGGSGERAARFMREIRAVGRLNHPNIVKVHATGEHDGVRYMAMEHVAGESLQDLLAGAALHGARMPMTDVLRFGIEIAHALHAAHEAGIVHRDVKPSNIRIASDGRAVLLDFGLARDASEATLTDSGAFRGSPQYASPEQVSSKVGAIDAKSDVYALGATLYEALSGAAPLRAETRDQLFHAILTQDPVPLRKLHPALPKDLETVVMAAIEKDPGRRHQTAASLAADLEAVRDGRPVSVRPVSGAGRLARWARRSPAKAALALALVLGVPTIATLGGFILANLERIDDAAARETAAALARRLEVAFLELGEGDPGRAEALFEAILADHPGSPEAMAGKALSLTGQHRSEKALAYLATIAHAGAWVERVRDDALGRLLRAGDNPSRPASRPIDDFADGMRLLARYHRGERAAAEEAFAALSRAVLAAPAPSAIYHYELGHAAWHARRDREARAIAAAIAQLWPDSPERRFAICRTLLRADRAAAEPLLRDLARNPPRGWEARSFIAYHLADLAQDPEVRAQALDLARAAAAAHPADAYAHRVVGSTLLVCDRYEEAVVALNESLRITPASADTLRELARAHVKLGDHERAMGPAREATRLAPGIESSWNLLGIALAGSSRLDEAITSFEKGLAIDPDDAQIWFNLGAALRRRGDHARALEAARRSHELGSRLPRWRQPSAALIEACEKALRGAASRPATR